MDTTARFGALIAQPGEIRLDEVAMTIAAHATPALDIDTELARLDFLATQVAEPTLEGVRRLLFRDMGFAGNRDEYYDPANSFLNEVLDRRLGNPITLSILMIGVARRCQVPLDPVGMPGHFLVRDRVDRDVFVDPFHQGALLDTDGCRAVFQRLAGPTATFDEAFLAPTPAVAVAARILNNLVASYRQRGEIAGLAWSAMLRTMIPGGGVEGFEKLADVVGRAGHYQAAARILDNLAKQSPSPDLTTRARSYWSRLN